MDQELNNEIFAKQEKQANSRKTGTHLI